MSADEYCTTNLDKNVGMFNMEEGQSIGKAFEFLRGNVDNSVADEFREELKEWFDRDTVVSALNEIKHYLYMKKYRRII